MAKTIAQRKSKTLLQMIKKVKESELPYNQVIPLISIALDLYIAGDSKIRRCKGNSNRRLGTVYECDRPISKLNKTGLCNICYARMYKRMKTKAYKDEENKRNKVSKM